MFATSGSLGIFAIGIVGGFYFARFFDAKEQKLTAAELVALLTVLGLGVSALVLIRAYVDLNLLDPYGIGVLLGAVVNVVLNVVSKMIVLGRARPVVMTADEAQRFQESKQPAGERPRADQPAVYALTADPNDIWVNAGFAILSLTSSRTGSLMTPPFETLDPSGVRRRFYTPP